MKRTILALSLLLGHVLYGQEKYPFQAEVKGLGPAVILIPGMSSGGVSGTRPLLVYPVRMSAMC